MGATAKTGTAIFRGLKSGITYSKGFYNPDVAGSLVRWDVGGAAGAATPDFTQFPEPVVLEDLSVVTGIVDTSQVRVIANQAPTTHLLQWANHVNTLNNRPRLSIGFRANTSIAFMCSLPAA
jgi:hypothetical protein